MTVDEIGGWFPDANRRTLERLLVKHQIRSVIEIGSFLGLSAAWFASRVDHVICVDLWREDAKMYSNNNLVATLEQWNLPRDFYHLFLHNMRQVGVLEKITPIRGNSRDVHALVEDADLVYIDGDHSFDGCISDIRLYGPKARKVICGDDYLVREEFGVIEAVNLALPAPQCVEQFWFHVKVG